MSHLKLDIVISSDGDAVNELVHSIGSLGALAVHLGKISEQLHSGRSDATIMDANGNAVGHWYASEVVDSVTRASCGHPAYKYREDACAEMTCHRYVNKVQ